MAARSVGELAETASGGEADMVVATLNSHGFKMMFSMKVCARGARMIRFNQAMPLRLTNLRLSSFAQPPFGGSVCSFWMRVLLMDGWPVEHGEDTSPPGSVLQ